ncbi:MAG: hypothetical protein WDO14_24805 [Bacteroidota bacterium]
MSVKLALFKFAPAMKRVVIGFFLFLLLFLSGGYTQLYAHGVQDRANYIPVKFLTPVHPVTDKRLYNIDATTIEEQDDNTSASRRLLDCRPVLYTPSYFVDYTIMSLESSRPSPSTPSSRCFVLLRVFRI